MGKRPKTAPSVAARAAITKLGAKQDGVLRSYKRYRNGALQDAVLFSILRHEWPTVDAHLRHRLRHRHEAYRSVPE